MSVRVFVIHRPISRDESGFPLEPKHTGAILEYFHVVREEDGGERISSIKFEADRELLRSTLHGLALRIARDYELTDFECFRRVGEVPAGEPCLLVRVASPHYHEAFRAMSDFLEELREVEITALPVLL
ncbi:MAG TPA: molybdenum cofactor biosynthesis protein MoaE [Candidatus Kapabacteria bacterium]|jgi:molybdopterin synthase catalytic subunit|nr:molybdenum cofactor biosynthesis protein MoaE [Candidatus Kapabacteria bacterium]